MRTRGAINQDAELTRPIFLLASTPDSAERPPPPHTKLSCESIGLILPFPWTRTPLKVEVLWRWPLAILVPPLLHFVELRFQLIPPSLQLVSGDFC